MLRVNSLCHFFT